MLAELTSAALVSSEMRLSPPMTPGEVLRHHAAHLIADLCSVVVWGSAKNGG